MKILATIWKIIILDEKEIKSAADKIKQPFWIWVIVLGTGATTFLGQFWVTRTYLYPPYLSYLIYSGATVLFLVLITIITAYTLASQLLGEKSWPKFWLTAGLGAAIVWVTIIPQLSIIGLWFVVILKYVIKIQWQTTTEKAFLIAAGAVVIALVLLYIARLIFGLPQFHLYL